MKKRDAAKWFLDFWVNFALVMLIVMLFAPKEIDAAFWKFVGWFCFDFMKPWGLILFMVGTVIYSMICDRK